MVMVADQGAQMVQLFFTAQFGEPEKRAVHHHSHHVQLAGRSTLKSHKSITNQSTMVKRKIDGRMAHTMLCGMVVGAAVGHEAHKPTLPQLPQSSIVGRHSAD